MYKEKGFIKWILPEHRLRQEGKLKTLNLIDIGTKAKVMFTSSNFFSRWKANEVSQRLRAILCECNKLPPREITI